MAVCVTLRADVNQVDDTGFVWAFLSEAYEPQRIWAGAIVVAGDEVELFMALVVDVEDGLVHLDVLCTPGQLIDELRHAGLLPA